MKSLIATLLAALPASAAVFTFDMPGEGSAIPDNSPSGITDTRTIDVPGIIRDIMVTLHIDGGFNGEYYASLSHDSGFTGLLNRVGSDSTVCRHETASAGRRKTRRATAIPGLTSHFSTTRPPVTSTFTGRRFLEITTRRLADL